jgi:hypothetical protein
MKINEIKLYKQELKLNGIKQEYNENITNFHEKHFI